MQKQLHGFWIYFSMVAIPLYVRHHVTFKEPGGGRMDITIGPKQTMGKTVKLWIFLIYIDFLWILIFLLCSK